MRLDATMADACASDRAAASARLDSDAAHERQRDRQD
jgi:hypothetical protein